jgi:YbbR domain-containing protein
VVNGEAGLVVQTKTGKADFRGWAVDSNSNTTPELLNVVLTSVEGVAYIFEGAQRVARPDVVKAYKQEAFLNSGFKLTADVSTLANGTYSVSLQMPLDNSVVVCKTKKVLLVN